MEKEDSSSTAQLQSVDGRPPGRLQRVIVLGTVGRPLNLCKSVLEILQVFHDLLKSESHCFGDVKVPPGPNSASQRIVNCASAVSYIETLAFTIPCFLRK